MLFLNSIGSILSIVIMISIGYFLTAKDWFSDESSRLLTKLVMGGITTPLSMIFIGICIYSVKLKNIKVSKDMVGIIAGRFIISPLTVFLITLFIPIPLLMKEVFIIQAAMPVMTNTSIIARDYNGDTEYAAVMTVVTTVLSIIAIPFYMLLLSYL